MGTTRRIGGWWLALAAAAILALLVAACGAAAPSTQAPSIGPSPGSSAAPSSPGSDLDDGAGRAIAGFAAFLADPGRTYHVESTHLVTVGDRPLDTYRWSTDVHGRDFASTMRVAESRSEERGVGDVQWSRAEGEGWQRATRDPHRFVLALQPAACLGNIRDLDIVEGSGRAGEFAFAYAGPIEFVPDIVAEGGGSQVTVDARVVLAPDGRPVSIDCTMAAEVDAADGGRQPMEVAWSMAFSDVGGPVAITPPESPTPAPTPSSTPTTPPAAGRHPALARFEALISDPRLSFHMHQTASMTGEGLTIEFDYDIDVSRRDFAAIVRFAGQATELRGIGGTAYVRNPDGSWSRERLTDEVAAGITDVWRYLGPLEALRKAGSAARPAGAIEFMNTGPVPYQTGMMQDAGVVGEITSLTFVVRRDGTPVSLRFTAAAPETQGVAFEIESVVTFSEVGEPHRIEIPKD